MLGVIIGIFLILVVLGCLKIILIKLEIIEFCIDDI